MSTMNTTHADVTDATENFIRELFANDDPLPVAELKIRGAIAKAAVKAWYEEAQGLTLREVHESEYFWLDELASELPAGAPASLNRMPCLTAHEIQPVAGSLEIAWILKSSQHG